MKTKTTKPEYLTTLKTIAPGIAITVSRTRDDSYTWDGDGEDPVERGIYPFDVDVTAKAIINGEIVEGSASLGGSYFEPEEPIGDVHGYLPQMLEEAIEDLATDLEKAGKVDTLISAQNAVNFLKRLMRERYEAQQAAKH